MRTDRRKVLVTGAGLGIGKAIAERLAQRGDEVIGTVRDPDRARALTEQQPPGRALRYEPLELGSTESIDALAASLEAQGGVDVVVHNAGFGIFGPVEEVDESETRRQLEVNVLGPLRLTRKLLPGLRARRGRVVFVGSMAGRAALPFQAHYSATKAAIASLSDALRLELAPFGVAVTCVEPGDFATGFFDARRRLTREDSPYRKRAEACLAAVEQQERGGADPAWVARVVDGLTRSRKPPARRPVGRWARTLALLIDVMPDRLRERVVRAMYRV